MSTKHFTLFYDGDCPLCKREIEFLKKKTGDSVSYQDISAEGFSAPEEGKTKQVLMAEIHGLRTDGTWLVGMDVFRELYSYTPYSWLMNLTALPGLRPLFDFFYKQFAKNRLRLTGRRCQS